jgi:hypothetical protein
LTTSQVVKGNAQWLNKDKRVNDDDIIIECPTKTVHMCSNQIIDFFQNIGEQKSDGDFLRRSKLKFV